MSAVPEKNIMACNANDEYTEYVLQEIATEYAKNFPEEYSPSNDDGLRVDM